MKENLSKHKTIGERIIEVQDIMTTCPKCGGELGIWSEDIETVCIFCDLRVFERENTIH